MYEATQFWTIFKLRHSHVILSCYRHKTHNSSTKGRDIIFIRPVMCCKFFETLTENENHISVLNQICSRDEQTSLAGLMQPLVLVFLTAAFKGINNFINYVALSRCKVQPPLVSQNCEPSTSCKIVMSLNKRVQDITNLKQP